MTWLVAFMDIGREKRAWTLELEDAPNEAIALLRESVEKHGGLAGTPSSLKFSFDPDVGCGYVLSGNRQVGQFTYHFSPHGARAVQPSALAEHLPEPAPASESSQAAEPSDAPKRVTRAQLAAQTPPVIVVPDAAEREREVLRDVLIGKALDLYRAKAKLVAAKDARERRMRSFEVASCEAYLLEAIEATPPAAIAQSATGGAS